MKPYAIRRTMWGTLLIWIGVMLVVDEPAGVASLGAGIILLLSVFFRKAIGLAAGFVLPVAGALLILFGINDLNGDDQGIPLFAVALISFGAFIIVRALTVARGQGGTSIEIRNFYRAKYGRRPPDDSV